MRDEAALGAVRALTPADFSSREVFELERRRLFAPAWIPVCRSDEVAEFGAQKATFAATTPVLVVRDEDGTLRAFSNVCRHRGLTLVEDRAVETAIRCPYHLWTYDLAGRLQASPFMDQERLGGCDLPTYACGEWGGFVFVNPDGRAAPLAQQLAPLAEAIRPGRLAPWKVGFRLVFDHSWNWKVMVENFGESYHHIGAHTATLQPFWPGGRSDPSASTPGWIELRHTVDPQMGTFTVFVVFPLFLLAVSDPHGSAYWYRMVTLGPERIALEIVGLFEPELAADAAEMEAARAQVLAIHLEDIPMCERVQAGLNSPDAALGPLSHLEAGVARFRDWVAAGIAGPPSG
ncbi:MAG TPA: aromatic ring-hydroxylating dioxygenase subunit alpha [Caulobacteraceae bacterium]|nr:aromatic ring-hydroxylating dioxygenase subunit alpha [Caulobacteraceae bacterium]